MILTNQDLKNYLGVTSPHSVKKYKEKVYEALGKSYAKGEKLQVTVVMVARYENISIQDVKYLLKH